MQYIQPQTQFSAIVKQHSTNQVQAWLISWQFKPFDAALLAPALTDRAIAEQVDSAPTEISVLLSEHTKIELLVAIAKRIMSQSEQHNRVDALLADLINHSNLLAPDLPVTLEPDAEIDGA